MQSTNNNAEQSTKLLCKPDEAARQLSVSPRTLWGMTKAGEIPSIRLGRSVRYSVKDLEAFIDRNRHSADTN